MATPSGRSATLIAAPLWNIVEKTEASVAKTAPTIGASEMPFDDRLSHTSAAVKTIRSADASGPAGGASSRSERLYATVVVVATSVAITNASTASVARRTGP